MNRERLQQIIRTSVQEVAHEYLKELSRLKQIKDTDNFLNSSSISEDDFDTVFFHGGQNPDAEGKNKRGQLTINENTNNNLKITTSEIKEFENSFKDILDRTPGASIVFDKQKNGFSIIATKRTDGVEAKASGILNLGDKGKIVWSYSLLNGFNVNAQNLKLSDSNKFMFEALTNHYNDWQKTWRDKLNLPSAPSSEENNIQAGADMGGMEIGQGGAGIGAQTGPGSAAPTPEGGAAGMPAAPTV